MAGRTKSEEIAQEIRRRVLSGDYPRGTRLRQDRLSADFGVSTTPVREALRILESERLLVAEPHRGVRVAELIDVDTIRAAYVVRRLTETFAVRRAASRLSRHDLAVLHGLLDEAEGDGDLRRASERPGSAVRPGRPSEHDTLFVGRARKEGRSPAEGRARAAGFIRAQEANHAFHFYFYARCGVPGLAARIEQLWATFPWDVMLSDPRRAAASQAEHRRILTAARSGDPDRLEAAFEQHLAAGMAALAAALGVPAGDPFDGD